MAVNFLTRSELEDVFSIKYGRLGKPALGPRLGRRLDYYSPDVFYEALVARLVTPGCTWADIGCGRDIFPNNPSLARTLADRCSYLLGVDPDSNIEDNPFVTERFRGLIDNYKASRAFDLVTMRMVAEHIARPDAALGAVARILRPGGKLVVYTPYKWTPVAIATQALPFWLHHPIKRVLWGGDERDTFPTEFQMNTRGTLARLASGNGLNEVLFAYLDDCRVTSRWLVLNALELATRRLCRFIGLRHVECCILATYERA